MTDYKPTHILDFGEKTFQEVMKLFNVTLEEQKNIDPRQARILL